MIQHLILDGLTVAGGLFLALLVFIEIGYRIGRRKRHEKEAAGTGAVEAAIFALLGLLIAFTFSGAAERFDHRRTLIVDEANAIGTAYLRLALLPPDARRDLEERFRRYLDTRLAAYRALPDVDAAMRGLESANAMQREIWDRAVAASAGSMPAVSQVLPAINEMFDISTTRTMAAMTHPPLAIFAMLIVLAALTGLLSGIAMASEKRPWLHSIVYALALAGAVYVIIDMEYPRAGLIRVDSFDSVLDDVRKSMK